MARVEWSGVEWSGVEWRTTGVPVYEVHELGTNLRTVQYCCTGRMSRLSYIEAELLY